MKLSVLLYRRLERSKSKNDRGRWGKKCVLSEREKNFYSAAAVRELKRVSHRGVIGVIIKKNVHGYDVGTRYVVINNLLASHKIRQHIPLTSEHFNSVYSNNNNVTVFKVESA